MTEGAAREASEGIVHVAGAPVGPSPGCSPTGGQGVLEAGVGTEATDLPPGLPAQAWGRGLRAAEAEERGGRG